MAQNDSNTNKPQANVQLALFAPGSLVDDTISQVFTSTPVKKDGVVQEGQFTFKADGNKALRERLDLKGKGNTEKLELAILDAGDMALRLVKARVASLDNEATLKRYTRKNVAGYQEETIVIKHVPRKVTATTVGALEAEHAEAMGVSVEEFRAMVAEHRKKKAAQNVDVTSTIVPPAQLPPAPEKTEQGTEAAPSEPTPEEKDAAALAKLEAEEAQKQAAADQTGK